MSAQSGPLSKNLAKLFPGTLLLAIQGDRGIASSGGIITGVTDQNSGLLFTSNSPGQRPLIGTAYNGHQTIGFDGVDDEVSASLAIAAPATTPFYVYAVFKPFVNTNQCTYFGGSGSSVATLYSPPSLSALSQYCGATGNTSTITSALTRIYAEYTGSSSDRLKSGSNAFVAGTSAGNNGSTVYLMGAGTLAGAYATRMDLAQLDIGLGALTASQLAAIDAETKDYWRSGIII